MLNSISNWWQRYNRRMLEGLLSHDPGPQGLVSSADSFDGWVELSHVEDVLIQAMDFANEGAGAETVVDWISEQLIPTIPDAK